MAAGLTLGLKGGPAVGDSFTRVNDLLDYSGLEGGRRDSIERFWKGMFVKGSSIKEACIRASFVCLCFLMGKIHSNS